MDRRIVRLSLVALMGLIAAVGCSSSGSKGVIAESRLTNEGDSLAYIIGMNIAEQLLKMDSLINVDVLCRAIIEHTSGKGVITAQDAKDSFLHYLLYAEPERRRGYEEQFLADLAANDRTFTRSKSGLTYNIKVIGDEKNSPKGVNDWVTVRYTISRIGGEKILSPDGEESFESSSALPDLIDGLSQSIKMIGVGGKIEAWIPSKLAYGEVGNEQLGIEPIETLHFDIELISTEKGAATRAKDVGEF